MMNAAASVRFARSSRAPPRVSAMRSTSADCHSTNTTSMALRKSASDRTSSRAKLLSGQPATRPRASTALTISANTPVIPLASDGAARIGSIHVRRTAGATRSAMTASASDFLVGKWWCNAPPETPVARSEEHTSELQSLADLVCRLLLEKKKVRLLHQFGETRRLEQLVGAGWGLRR